MTHTDSTGAHIVSQTKPCKTCGEVVSKYEDHVCASQVAAPPALPVSQEPVAPLWMRITAPGQVKVGTKLRFNIGDKNYAETAKQILDPGTAKEEIIYNKRKNYYLITSMAINGTGSAKNVEYLATPHPAEQTELSDQEIDELLVIYGKGDDGFRSFARAVLSAAKGRQS